MRTLVRILLAVFALAVPLSASAQTSPQVTRGQAVNAEFDHPEFVETEFYVHTVAGVGYGATSSPLPRANVNTTGTGRFTFTAPTTAGIYTLVVRAANTDQFADSDPYTFQVVKGQPTKPGKPRATNAVQVTSIRGTLQDYARAALRQPEPEPAVFVVAFSTE